MKHRVLLTDAAEQDLEALYDYIADSTSAPAASRVLDRLINVIDSLAASPERGGFPKELLELGNRRYRQAVLKPWRIVYRVTDRLVYVLLIAKDRRDMRTLLGQRLLSA